MFSPPFYKISIDSSTSAQLKNLTRCRRALAEYQTSYKPDFIFKIRPERFWLRKINNKQYLFALFFFFFAKAEKCQKRKNVSELFSVLFKNGD